MSFADELDGTNGMYGLDVYGATVRLTLDEQALLERVTRITKERDAVLEVLRGYPGHELPFSAAWWGEAEATIQAIETGAIHRED